MEILIGSSGLPPVPLFRVHDAIWFSGCSWFGILVCSRSRVAAFMPLPASGPDQGEFRRNRPGRNGFSSLARRSDFHGTGRLLVLQMQGIDLLCNIPVTKILGATARPDLYAF